MPVRCIVAACLFGLPFAGSASAQPFDSGPPGTVVGSSMAGAPVAGSPRMGAGGIGNAPVFGDTVEERTYGRDYDDSYLRPHVPRARSDDHSAALRARQGQPGLDPARADAFARSGPTAIGRSSVTRPTLGGRARIRR